MLSIQHKNNDSICAINVIVNLITHYILSQTQKNLGIVKKIVL